MKTTVLHILAICLLFCCRCSGQSDAANSSMVVVFQTDPKKFSTFQIDGQPVAANQVPMEYPSTWPVVAGKREVLLSANGAENAKATVEFFPQKPTILLVGLVPNKDASKAASFPQQITLSVSPVDLTLPTSDLKAPKVYAFLLGKQPLNAEVQSGRGAPKKILLEPKKVMLVGSDSLGIFVGGRSVAVANPGEPGNYVLALLPTQDGKLRSIPFSYIVEEEEKPSPRRGIPTED